MHPRASEELSIDNNYFNESLPENLYKLKDLEYLVANNNKFTGTLQPEIGALTKLRLLQLRDNNFHGNLPSSMKNLLEVGKYLIGNCINIFNHLRCLTFYSSQSYPEPQLQCI
jgi:hypothetical protein